MYLYCTSHFDNVIVSIPMASNLQDSPVQQRFVEEIDYSEIQQIRIVGKGAFGVVWKGVWRNTFVAVKHINSEAERREFAIEVRQLSRVSHPNIVRLYGACTQPEHVCLVMEYAEGGSLYNVLHYRPKPKYTAAHAMSWARQCAEGVAYLHAMKPKPLIHRDLKPPNLLLVGGGQRLKICDFGTAVDKATIMTNNKGSAAWMAPEVFEGYSYTEKCDVFSWGIILWEVLSRKMPYDEENVFRIMWAVHSGHRPNLIEGCPKPIEKLMTQCWHMAPAARPSMAEVVETMSTLCEFFPGAEEPIDYEECEEEAEDPRADSQRADSAPEVQSGARGGRGPRPPAAQDSLLAVRSPVFSESSSPKRLSPIANYNIGNMNPRHMDIEQYWNRENDLLSPGRGSSVTSNSNSFRKEDYNQNYCDRLSAGGSPMNPMKEYNGNSLQRQKLQKPLEIEVDPDAWELQDPNIYGELLGVRNSAGFDKFFPLDSSGSSPSAGAPPDPALDAMHLMLDPHLRPLSPDPASDESKRIYEEHKQMAPEYLRVQTELAYKSKQKSELEAQMDEEELRQKREIIQLENEKESLIKLYCSLKKQLARVENEHWRLPEDMHD